MKKLSEFFIDNYKFTFVLSVFILIFGVMGLMRINAESYPSVNFATATITTPYDGASAEDIETRITKPIEDEVRTVSGLKDVKSISQPGLSTVVVRADIDNVDVEKLMSELQRAIDRVTGLPADLKDKPVFKEIKSEEFPVIEVAIVGSNELRQRDKIVDLLKEDIEDNDRVLDVRKVGYRKRAFQISLDVKQLKRHHIGIDEVIDKIKVRNQNIPGGKIETSKQQKLIRIEGEIESKADLDRLLIRSNFSGKSIYLKDIATVVDGEESARIISNYNGRAATLLVVRKKGGADTIAMVTDISEKLDRFRKKYKAGYQFEVYNNEALKVKNKLNVLSSNAVSGLALVVFFLLLFLPGRIGLMASLSLPLAVLATMGFMPIFDMNLNAITILALVIALGMLVDNSVVISENFARLRADGASSREAATQSIAQLWLPITATVLTTIAAFLPMLVTKGIMGQFIRFIPIIVSIALLLSLVESFFFLPMRLIKFDGGRKATSADGKGWFEKLASKFEKLVRWAVRYRYLSLIIYGVLLVSSIMMMAVFNKLILFPADQTEIYIGRLEMTQGATLNDTQTEIARVVKRINEVSGSKLSHLVTRSGSASMGPADPKGKDGDHVGLILLYVNDDTKFNTSDDIFLKPLRAIESSTNVQALSFEAMVNGPPVGEPVNVTFRSNQEDRLSLAVQEIMDYLNSVEGIRDVKVDDVLAEEQVLVRMNYEKANQLGLEVKAVGNTIRAALAGKVVSTVNLDNKDVDLIVRLTESQRDALPDLKQIEVMDKRGNLIPISYFSQLSVEGAKPHIKRFDFKRAKTITANLDSEKMTAVKANKLVEKKFASLKANYDDVSMVFGGEGQNTKESMDSLWSALVLSLIGIFALLVFLFNSFMKPFMIMTTIPLGLVGFSIAFLAHGRPISFLALIGVIGLGGIIVNSGIILISFIDEMQQQGGDLFDNLVKASRIRFRAVLVSSLTTISGLIPTAYGVGGSDPMLVPMTLAMAWGLTSGTVLTLIWIPSIYAITDDVQQFVGRLLFRGKAVGLGTSDLGTANAMKKDSLN